MVSSEDNPVLVWVNLIKDGFNSGDPVTLGILVAVAVVFITIGKVFPFYCVLLSSNYATM